MFHGSHSELMKVRAAVKGEGRKDRIMQLYICRGSGKTMAEAEEWEGSQEMMALPATG